MLFDLFSSNTATKNVPKMWSYSWSKNGEHVHSSSEHLRAGAAALRVQMFVQMFVCAGVRRSGEWVKRSGCCASAEALGRINTLMMWSLHLHHHQLSGCLGQSLRSNPLSRCLTFDDVSRPASVSGVEMICDWRTVRKPTCCRLKHEELPRV